MNQNALKSFAQTARRELRKQIELRLDFVLRTDSAELRQRAAQVKALKEALALEGRDALVERVAYTWFNRLAALRFMDANGYHPFGARVVTAASAQETLPEVLQQARAGVLDADLRAQLDTAETFDGVLSGAIPTASREGSAYRMLLVAACHYYHRLMPFLFEKLGDATELLLPEDLLTEQSVVNPFRTELADVDCRDVEVIGWLYQFYISEKKDAVMARKAAVPTEDIPAVTQLFTPHWIVRYLVENSLGRLWLLNRPGSRLREHMPYFIGGEPEIDFLKIEKPEHIRLVDPAGGSGHMLTYAFDLLYLIYEEEGYDTPEIPSLILRHNLYGLEICDRAAALAAFALCMKARSRDKRFFRRLADGGADVPRPRIIELRDARFAENELRDYIRALGLGDLFNQPLLQLLHQFEEAKNFGSLIQPCLDERAIAFARRAIEAKDLGGQLFLRETHLKVLRVLEQAEALTQRYHVVVANPPYMGDGQQNSTVKAFLREHYLDSKADLFACFIERSIGLSFSNGYAGLVTRHGWMFITSFEKLRTRLLREKQLISLAHLGARGFDSISGEVVQVAAFVFQNRTSPDAAAQFRDLRKGRDEGEKETLFLNPNVRHVACASQFLRIPGAPVCYWLSIAAIDAFGRNPRLGDLATIRAGLQTGDNNRFLRLWHEVGQCSLGFGYQSRADAKMTTAKWFPINKGGSFRKWCGNSEYVINWFNDGEELKRQKAEDLASGRITANNSKCWNQDHYFKRGLSWSAVSSEAVSVRLNGDGYLFDTTGQTAFPEGNARHETLLALLNSGVAEYFLNALSPTMHFNSGNFADLPVPISVQTDALVTERANKCVGLARADWDNFETSWDFRDQPLLRPGLKGATLEASWRNWEAQSTAAIRRMQELETENNRLFISAYGLDGELQPEVPEEQITLARADARKDAAALLSYAVGCMMGRYSLNEPALILADAGATVQDYRAKVPNPTFAPDTDGILPVLDGDWFPDDIVGRFREFLRVTYGDATVAENLTFIENSLGKVDAKTGKVKATDVRTYFVRDFYKNHTSNERGYGYKKRPIYWMVSSPEGSFQALIYLHRYTRDTVNTLLNAYVREFIHKLEVRHQETTAVTLNESARPAERTKATKDAGKIDKMLKELRAWERDVVLPLAQQRIELDLDDGVKTNYLKFPGLLVPIAGLEKKDDE